ncbi:MAG: hypothetical protein L0338_25490 [Acidobacteria bacterium]|nr:hypothetical protein [Acidobacteriota bacterium]
MACTQDLRELSPAFAYFNLQVTKVGFDMGRSVGENSSFRRGPVRFG